MTSKPAKNERKQREAILRGVYQENVDLNKPGFKSSSRSPKRRLLMRSSTAGLGALLLAAAVLYDPVVSRLQPTASATAAQGAAYASGPVAPALPRPDEITAHAVEPRGVLRDVEEAARMTVRDLFGLSVRTIVIDAGHGGRDPGTTGTTGAVEKDITLEVARALQATLQRNAEFQVLLVRDSDVFVSLSERAAYANSHDADLFVSIHVNYVPGMSKNAVETYYFGQYQDLAARALAQRENQYSSYTISEFEKLATRMQNTMKLQESEALATSIQSSLMKNMRRHDPMVVDTGVRAAPFVVLLGVKAPSVLVEIGNLGSVDAEQKLQDARYRDQIAAYLAAGITDYLNETNDGNLHHVKGQNGIAQH
ncbi:MAG: N-acetylmuramoyl-L-alanine amidase family protein [Pseudomonadales bacterium]